MGSLSIVVNQPDHVARSSSRQLVFDLLEQVEKGFREDTGSALFASHSEERLIFTTND